MKPKEFHELQKLWEQKLYESGLVDDVNYKDKKLAYCATLKKFVKNRKLEPVHKLILEKRALGWRMKDIARHCDRHICTVINTIKKYELLMGIRKPGKRIRCTRQIWG